MKLSVIAPALLMLLSTSCAKTPPPAVLRPLVPDPAVAGYAACPSVFPPAPTLPALSSFTLPDGREVALLDNVFARETATVKYILQGREAWHQCEGAVRYTEDWSATVSKPVSR